MPDIIPRKKLIIEEPGSYFSYLDECHFFSWLESIKAIDKITRVYVGKGSGTGLELVFKTTPDEMDIRDLIAIMMRYNIDMSCLKILCTSENVGWLKNPEAYWYTKIFCT
jgi:hypothetical protein